MKIENLSNHEMSTDLREVCDSSLNQTLDEKTRVYQIDDLARRIGLLEGFGKGWGGCLGCLAEIMDFDLDMVCFAFFYGSSGGIGHCSFEFIAEFSDVSGPGLYDKPGQGVG